MLHEEKLHMNEQQRSATLKEAAVRPVATRTSCHLDSEGEVGEGGREDDEANRHLAAMEQDTQQWCEALEVDASAKAARLKEFKDSQKVQNKAVGTHHKALLDLEKSLHGRTMGRTVGRVVRHVKLGDGDSRGPDTPTREYLRSFPLTARAQEGSLKRVGGSLVADTGSLAIE
mmetsp:Transcript_138987/g.387631  ORF Transcript_138987/g.387631 Transcript_138987/m.387631 type:complete len:173 (+) Transcript_138987:87-605(+)